DGLRIPANSAFLDGTLLMTVEALLGPDGPDVLTPVTLWELTTFIDALVCFDRLYCVATPAVDVARFNQRLGAPVLTAVPDPPFGVLRQVAREAADHGVSDMSVLRARAGSDDAWGQEVKAVVDGWQAVLGTDIPDDGPFDLSEIDTRLARMPVAVASAEPVRAKLTAILARQRQAASRTAQAATPRRGAAFLRFRPLHRRPAGQGLPRQRPLPAPADPDRGDAAAAVPGRARGPAAAGGAPAAGGQ